MQSLVPYGHCKQQKIEEILGATRSKQRAKHRPRNQGCHNAWRGNPIGIKGLYQ